MLNWHSRGASRRFIFAQRTTKNCLTYGYCGNQGRETDKVLTYIKRAQWSSSLFTGGCSAATVYCRIGPKKDRHSPAMAIAGKQPGVKIPECIQDNLCYSRAGYSDPQRINSWIQPTTK